MKDAVSFFFIAVIIAALIRNGAQTSAIINAAGQQLNTWSQTIVTGTASNGIAQLPTIGS